jgi:benzil reductase ((S)-benzoin forming)
MKKLFIITGTSRGLGAALAENLIRKNHHLICFSRTENPALVESAKSKNVDSDYYLLDLSNVQHATGKINDVFNGVDIHLFDSVTLVNNAGLLEPVQPIAAMDISALNLHMQTNLTAAMGVTSCFAKAFRKFKGKKEVIFISSGAAKNPYEGWGAYCAAKSGLLMFARVLALEQQREPYPVKVVSVAPGVVETHMQQLIRSSTDQAFPLKQKFIELKNNHQVYSPDEAAKKIISNVIGNDNVVSGDELDIRKM